eukprot:2609746-Ditylum_brightwellii.AAC.1
MDLHPNLKEKKYKDIAEQVLEVEYDLYVKHIATYNDNKHKMYAVAYSQCSEAMQAKLESDKDYKEAAAESDIIKLLKVIKKISYHYQSQQYPYCAVHQAMQAIYFTSQRE